MHPGINGPKLKDKPAIIMAGSGDVITHQQLNEEQQKSTGVTSDLVRLSIGLEDPADLIEDLKNAIKSL